MYKNSKKQKLSAFKIASQGITLSKKRNKTDEYPKEARQPEVLGEISLIQKMR